MLAYNRWSDDEISLQIWCTAGFDSARGELPIIENNLLIPNHSLKFPLPLFSFSPQPVWFIWLDIDHLTKLQAKLSQPISEDPVTHMNCTITTSIFLHLIHTITIIKNFRKIYNWDSFFPFYNNNSLPRLARHNKTLTSKTLLTISSSQPLSRNNNFVTLAIIIFQIEVTESAYPPLFIIHSIVSAPSIPSIIIFSAPLYDEQISKFNPSTYAFAMPLSPRSQRHCSHYIR